MDLSTKIHHLSAQLPQASIFLGGSHAKGTADSYSDRDYGLITAGSSTSEIENILESKFGPSIDVIKRPLGTAYHFIHHDCRFEIRTLSESTVQATIRKLACLELLDGSEQDLLFNLQIGQYFQITPSLNNLKNRIAYPSELRQMTIESYLPLLTIDELGIPLARGDQYQLMKALIDLQEVSFVLGMAESRRFLSNFKHECASLRSMPDVQFIYEASRQLVTHQDDTALENLNSIVNSFRERLLHEIAD